ncbi:TonB-dependent receptor [Sphingomonas sp. PAMC 26621]|uniref:TonB-dependent receptor n=1 Tax=Sphingomonas sp. PAMC 26621 TaxID=1112213 RepID=UPI00047479F6|nr:TonB-dependent receptor [Sphingomonas sp. PAMC 26621]
MKTYLLMASTIMASSWLITTGASAQDVTSAPVGSAAQTTDAAAPAPVQIDSGDIIVTATRRETSLQKTPLAVSAFSQATLDRQQVTNVTDLARFVPSLQFNQQGDQSAVLLTLRGIGNDTAFTEVADPEVAIYIDGIYSARAQGATVLFYDLERAEVLRGPQGTLFGRNATVGALSLITAKPKFEDGIHGYVEAIAGDYNRVGTRGALNVPITDNLAARFAFVTEQHDGYADYQPAPNVPNVDRSAFITTGKKYYAQDQKSGRVSLLWTPGRLSWNVSAEGFLDKGAPVISLLQTPRPGTKLFSTLSDTAPDTDRYSVAVRSDARYDLTDHMQVQYIAGFTRLGGSTQADADAGALPPTGGYDPATGLQLYLGAFGENRTVKSRYDFMSHEIQLKSTGKNRFDYILGGYYSHENNSIRFDVDQRDGYRDGATRAFVGSFIQAKRTIDSVAGFGQVTWHANEKLRLTGGLRYTHDRKADIGGRNITAFGCPKPGDASCTANFFGAYPDATAAQLLAFFPNGGFSISNNDVKGSWGKLTYLARADMDLTQNILGYASVSSGFKSGNIQDGGQTTNPETITNYEVGIKSRLFDRRLTLNLSAYYSDFRGYQVNQVINIRDASGNLIKTQVGTQNAQGAKAYGLEIEAQANITPHDRLQFSSSLQRTRLDTLIAIDGRFDDGGNTDAARDLAGNELAHAPRFSGTVTYEHDFELANGGKITPRATTHFETKSYLSYFNGDYAARKLTTGQTVVYGDGFDSQKAYTRSDFALRYSAPRDKFSVEMFVQNVENSLIRTGASTFGPTRYDPVFLSVYQSPRTFGGRVRAAF